MKTVLVTGGAGFIASHVVDLLVAKGYKVVVVDDLSAGSIANLNKKAIFQKVDIRTPNLEKVFAKYRPDVVVHAAAQIQVTRSVDDPLHDASINVLGGIHILECCKRFKVKKVVYLCTGGALYGDPEYLPADEEHPQNPISPYGASKKTLELYLHLYRHNFGLEYVSLRFANVYGPRDSYKSGRVIPCFVHLLLQGKAPFITGDGKQARDFIYVLDVADAVVRAVGMQPKHHHINVGSETLVSMNKLYALVTKQLASKVQPRYVPRRAGEVEQIHLKAERAKKELGWKPRYSIEKGVAAYINWVKQSGRS